MNNETSLARKTAEECVKDLVKCGSFPNLLDFTWVDNFELKIQAALDSEIERRKKGGMICSCGCHAGQYVMELQNNLRSSHHLCCNYRNAERRVGDQCNCAVVMKGELNRLDQPQIGMVENPITPETFEGPQS